MMAAGQSTGEENQNQEGRGDVPLVCRREGGWREERSGERRLCLGEGTVEDGSRPGESGRQRMMSSGFGERTKTMGAALFVRDRFIFRFMVVFFFFKIASLLLCVLKTSIYRQKYCLGLKIGPLTFFVFF